MKTTIKPASPGDEPEVFALLDRTFRPVDPARRRAMCRWRNEANPARAYLDLPAFLVAESGGSIVGVHGLFPLRMQVEGSMVAVSCACDFAVLPSARTVGLKLKLAAAKYGGAPIHVSTSANEAASRLTVALGGVEVEAGRTNFVKPFRMAPIVSRRAAGLMGGVAGKALGLVGAVAGGVWDVALGALRGPGSTGGALAGLKVAEADRFNDAHDALWYKVRGTADVQLIKDAAYLNWRYADSPLPGIVALEARQAGNVVALVVVQVCRDPNGSPMGSLLEFLYEPGRVAVGFGLLGLAEERLRNARAAACTARTASLEVAEGLVTRGFYRRERDTSPCTYRTESKKLEERLQSLQRWNVSLGDGDAAFHVG